MLSSLICGNFQAEEDELEFLRSCSSVKKSSRKLRSRHSFGTKGKDPKNPYADRGLDKFSALLAELDSKRQKIYTQKGSEDISLLGFIYTNSSYYKPIVVKKPVKTRAKPAAYESQVHTNIETYDHDWKKPILESMHVSKNNASSDNLKYLRKPSYYVPVIIILILLCLAIVGKSFAILCASAGWYIIPATKSGNLKCRKGGIKTKDHNITKNVTRDNSRDHGTPSSPTSVLNGLNSPPQGGSPLHRMTLL